MFRFGIVSRDQLPETLPPSGPLPELSFTLLAEFDDKLSQRDEAAIEIICQLDRSRTTFRQRHSSLDDVILEEIEKNFPSAVAIRIHDAAVSNAITSVGLFEKVQSRRNITLHATDQIIELFAVTIPGSRWRVIFDSKKRPLQFVGSRMVLAASRREPWRYPINRLIRQILRLTVLPEAQRRLALAEVSPSDNIERIGTFHPRAVALSRRDHRFSLGWADMSVPLAGPFEIVRAMNVFFSATPKQVEDAIQGLCAPLVDGGLLVIGRREAAVNSDAMTTIFKRQGQKLIPLRDVVGGARIRELALGLRLDQDVMPLK